ncbi:hypothetical protein Psal006b_00165 [Piscirickettsia salmonis]|uniref:Acetate kinase n=1 Tax=Piscirickettsia salmonis TaxID=1238 RepID=A0AAC8ZQ00_PISSA|nr:hypothetical protein [Piscirickettsia salmonis]AKP72370.1 hypothetical protein PSLF89_176 [Piscirickettsia salmonis LF-89 = ATCC VR-1361]ALB24182.1 acetate kinase [Piscirickettsia salmonis]ALY03983.1 hypothetical protein AWE47_14860 [Piscirickettsia salmonis]AMA43547.1 hypothetical protein AWJ11_15085 [Piscirickettsia salmonis]AOS36016.1 hypothetical protein AVM72_12200 [Piscirickettsia salmonis]
MEGVRKAIVNQLAGDGFELGYGGSRHAIKQGASFIQVPKRIADIMKIIEGNSRTPDEKLQDLRIDSFLKT